MRTVLRGLGMYEKSYLFLLILGRTALIQPFPKVNEASLALNVVVRKVV